MTPRRSALTYLRLRPVLVLSACLGALTTAGCSSGSPGVCPCPSGGAQIPVTGLPAPVASTSADSPCTVSNLGSSLLVNSTRAGDCQVRVQLTDGETYVSSVSFTGGGGCCPYTYFGTPTALERSDGGASAN